MPGRDAYIYKHMYVDLYIRQSFMYLYKHM